ncbi:DUF4181 domain-containing protein [Saccharibacillus sacchari]|uniref:DUF4181 domain-containing protein n=1 Tax=Saccharibacillus sacchari TaxID=456493 RepID=UPI0004B4F127|nr:DUF4181 domain-containing protein [Saccharibacillus sacchari]
MFLPLVIFLGFYLGLSYVLKRFLVKGVLQRIVHPVGRRIEVWGSIGLTVAGMVILFILYNTTGWEDIQAIIWFFAGYLSLQTGFRALLEWKYLKGSNQYLMSLIQLAFCLIYVAIWSVVA